MKNSDKTSAADDTVQEHMGGVEVLMNEGGTLKVVQHYSLRSLLRRPKGLERHRVLRWLNCNILPLHFKVPNTTKSPRSPDDFINRFLRAFFFITLSLGVIKILCEQYVMSSLLSTYNISPIYHPDYSYSYSYKMWLTYPFEWRRFKLPVILIAAAIAAAAIVKKKMKNTAFTTARKEEVKTISGLIQQV